MGDKRLVFEKSVNSSKVSIFTTHTNVDFLSTTIDVTNVVFQLWQDGVLIFEDFEVFKNSDQSSDLEKRDEILKDIIRNAHHKIKNILKLIEEVGDLI